MSIQELKRTWDQFGKTDPLWAILSVPDKKGNRWRLDDFFDSGIQEIDSVIEYMKSLGLAVRHQRALDFGCGVGRLTQALAKHFDEVIGLDIAPSMLQLARRYNRWRGK